MCLCMCLFWFCRIMRFLTWWTSDVLEQDYEFTCALFVIGDFAYIVPWYFTSDGVHHDLFPQNASCKCYFYDNLGQLSPNSESHQKRINDVLLRRFLRQGYLWPFIMLYNEVNTLHTVFDNFAALVSSFSIVCVPGCVFFSRIINFSHFGFIAVRLSERKRRRLDSSSVQSCISGANAKVFFSAR